VALGRKTRNALRTCCSGKVEFMDSTGMLKVLGCRSPHIDAPVPAEKKKAGWGFVTSAAQRQQW
jgi:hypothetical protein